MFPEAQNMRGDKKYLNAYKEFYKKEGYKDLIIDDQIMSSVEKLYVEGRKMIMHQYPQYYLWDFYRINTEFDFIYKDIPPDKKNSLVINLKLIRNRGTAHSFTIKGFTVFFGTHYNVEYNQHIPFSLEISDILNESVNFINENPDIKEQEFLSCIINQISDTLSNTIDNAFKETYEDIEEKYGRRVLLRAIEIQNQVKSIVNQNFGLNLKDETLKDSYEMDRDPNSYMLIQQRPLNYFIYHMDVDWIPQDNTEMSSHDQSYFENLYSKLRLNSILWFLDFVYRLRNALFHEIIDPLDADWQIIFKNAYLILKEIVEINIKRIKMGQYN